MIPKNHICFLIEDFVESLDFSNFNMLYDGENIKFAEDEKIDVIIVGKNKFLRSGSYTRKDGKKILTYYCKKLKKKKDVP
jgi:hypothetical protein